MPAPAVIEQNGCNGVQNGCNGVQNGSNGVHNGSNGVENGSSNGVQTNGLADIVKLKAKQVLAEAAKGPIVFGSRKITIDDVIRITRREAPLSLSEDPAFEERIHKGPLTLQKLLKDEHIIYGVNTGYGNSCTVNISKDLVDELPSHLVRFHCTGLGRHFDEPSTRALVTARLVSLVKGFSAVRLDLLKQLTTLLQNDILPMVPEEGSVGASGDLTPLSYVAAVLCGERKVMYKGEVRPTADVFEELGIKPLCLMPKEGLALMNGTSVMTGVACLAFHRAKVLAQLSTRLTSLAVMALNGNHFHYDATLFSVKDHKGQQLVARRMRQDLQIPDAPQNYSKALRIQDRYSLRCAPHIIGVLEDALPFFRTVIESELNSANDNPIIDTESERVFHGGMFYGGHIAFVMDSLKNLVANVADLMDRQMALLVDPNYNNGLPANLSGETGPRSAINHGLKALQIGMSAWTAEALKLTMPASVFSRSTESHNQDKVSMGTIASRDCIRVLELTEQVAAGLMVALRQASTLRGKVNPDLAATFSDEMSGFVGLLEQEIPFITEDMSLEPVLRQLKVTIGNMDSQLYREQ